MIWIRRRSALAAILVGILLASCGGRPDVTVSVDGQVVPMVLASTTDRTGCSVGHGDAFPQSAPVTAVGPRPPTLLVVAGPNTTKIRGWIYEADPVPPGGPIEEFTLSGPSGSYVPQKMTAGRTYQILLNVEWSAVITSGEVTHIFRIAIEKP